MGVASEVRMIRRAGTTPTAFLRRGAAREAPTPRHGRAFVVYRGVYLDERRRSHPFDGERGPCERGQGFIMPRSWE